mgnify:CR=1 FL=1
MGRQFAAARYLEDGSLDRSFNLDGKVLTDFHSTADEGGGAVAIDGAGRIVVAGSADRMFAVARYLEKGLLDPDFHHDGKVITDFRSMTHERFGGMAIDRWSRVVVAGYADRERDPGRFMAVARYTIDGDLDTSFHHDGKVITDFRSTEGEFANAVAIDHLGRIVVGGGAEERIALARYLDNGALDPSFHHDGKVITDFPAAAEDRVYALAIDHLGRIVAVGRADWNFAVARYLDDGTLDAGFGDGGRVVTDFPSTEQEWSSGVSIDRRGRIVVAGTADHTFALARYLDDGSLDASFGAGGKVRTDFRSSPFDYANAVAHDRDGRIVVCGSAASKFALARYLEDGSLDASFHHDGKVITDFGSATSEGAGGIAMDLRNRIVLGGWAEVDD